MSSDEDKEFCSATEAARLCDYSRQWWNALFRQGRTPKPVHQGGYMNLWSRKDVLEWKKNQKA